MKNLGKPRPDPSGHFQLLRWAGAWINEGEDHGRGCRFGTREDAEAFAAYENEHNYDGEARFAVIELPLPRANAAFPVGTRVVHFSNETRRTGAVARLTLAPDVVRVIWDGSTDDYFDPGEPVNVKHLIITKGPTS